MSLRIGEVIAEKRRKKAWTQERLANTVGVSTPAVSKWENNAAYPDITLLSSIARALDTTVDELLSYRAELSPEEVVKLSRQAAHTYESEGFDVGWSLCQNLIREYPNSAALKFQLGGLFQNYLILKPELTKETIQLYYSQSARVYEEVLESGNPQYTYPATLKLAAYYTMLDKLDQAEALLDSLPKIDVDPKALYPSVYSLKGEKDKAIKMTQENIRRYASWISQSLSILFAAALESGEYEKASGIATINLDLTKRLGIGQESAYMHIITGFIAKGDVNSALTYTEEYAWHITTLKHSYTDNPLLDQLEEPEYDPVYVKKVVAKSFLLHFSQEAFEPIASNPRFIAVADEMRKLSEA